MSARRVVILVGEHRHRRATVLSVDARGWLWVAIDDGPDCALFGPREVR